MVFICLCCIEVNNLLSCFGVCRIRDKMKSIYPIFQQLATGSKSVMKQTFTAILDKPTTSTDVINYLYNKLTIVSKVALQLS